MIRIRKMPPTETPDFPRRWVVSREPDDDGIADHIMGYFDSHQDAVEWLDYRPRIVVLS